MKNKSINSEENLNIETQLSNYVEKELKKWTKRRWLPLIIAIFFYFLIGVYLLCDANWSWLRLGINIKELNFNIVVSLILLVLNLFLNGYAIKVLYDRKENNSNIKNKKELLKDEFIKKNKIKWDEEIVKKGKREAYKAIEIIEKSANILNQLKYEDKYIEKIEQLNNEYKRQLDKKISIELKDLDGEINHDTPKNYSDKKIAN